MTRARSKLERLERASGPPERFEVWTAITSGSDGEPLVFVGPDGQRLTGAELDQRPDTPGTVRIQVVRRVVR